MGGFWGLGFRVSVLLYVRELWGFGFRLFKFKGVGVWGLSEFGAGFRVERQAARFSRSRRMLCPGTEVVGEWKTSRAMGLRHAP